MTTNSTTDTPINPAPNTGAEVAAAASPGQILTLFGQRASAGDVAALMALYDDNAVFQPEFGTELVGHDQITPALEEFVTIKPVLTYERDPEVIVVGDIALVTGFWSMSGSLPDGSTVGEAGTSADVMRRQSDGTWKILIDQPRGVPTAS